MPGVVVEQPVVEQPVEVVTTPEVVDYIPLWGLRTISQWVPRTISQ